MLPRITEDRILSLASRPVEGEPLSQRAIARITGAGRGTVADRIHHGRKPPSKGEAGEMRDNGDETAAAGRRCPSCGAALAVFPCRVCRVRLRRPRLFHVIGDDSAKPLRLDLEPDESARLLDTLTMASGKIARDRPGPRTFSSRAFRFQLGTTGPVFFARLHPPIAVVG